MGGCHREGIATVSLLQASVFFQMPGPEQSSAETWCGNKVLYREHPHRAGGARGAAERGLQSGASNLAVNSYPEPT